jgi:hypothetical protein
VAHWVENKIEQTKWANKIDEALENAGYTPYGKPQMTNEYVKKMILDVYVLQNLASHA